jgi:exoribonuclease R
MQKLKVVLHNRTYDSWEFTQDDVKVDIPNLIPSKHKLLHDDVILYKDETAVIVESPFKDSVLVGVLILGKTYGRSGKRLLYKCIPDNKLLPVFLVPYTADAGFSKVVKNKYIVFRFIDWSDDHPHGEIKETLGDVDSPEAFNEYQLYRRDLHLSLTPFAKASKVILRDSDPIQTILNTANYCIDDLRSVKNVFTIDPADCTDFDDAFSATEENGVATINVYIANVFVWLETYGLWEHMTDRVSTIYLPDKKRPMLPPILSDNLCSLKQGEDRFAFMMSVKYDMKTLEQICEPVFKNVLVHVSKNYAYEDRKLEKNLAYNVLRTLAKTDDSHDVVAFWMIQMNAKAAEHLRNRGKGIFRSTTEGATRSTTEGATRSTTEGATRSTTEGATRSTTEGATKENTATNTTPTIMQWLSNCGAGAVYSEVCAPHAQLGINAYVHITSPIRRLVDILNQIWFQPNITDLCQTFLQKWTQQLDKVNHATKDIRKTQMDCELLALANKNGTTQEYSGVLFDRNFVSGKYEYAVYIEEIKMFSRIKLPDWIENFTKSQFRIFVFNCEDRLCRKIQLQLRELVVFSEAYAL